MTGIKSENSKKTDNQSQRLDEQPQDNHRYWFSGLIAKISGAKLEAGWQWLIYLDIILPLLLFLAALAPIGGIRSLLARMFHNYMLYVLFPYPDFLSLSGFIAPALHLFLLIRALIRRQFADAVICLVFWLFLLAFFSYTVEGTALNYYILRFLDFGL